MRVIGFVAAWLFMVGAVSAAGLTGTYVTRSDTAAVIILLVQTGDGRVTGRLEQSLVTDKGTVETKAASLNGAADGSTAVLTLAAEQFLGGAATVSATLTGDQLLLTGKGIDLRLRAGDVDEYRSALTALALSAEISRQSRAEAKALEELRTFNTAAKTFATETVDRLARFSPTEATFRDATERMRKGLAKVRSIIGGDEASVARSQIAVAMSQTEVEASAAYGRVQAAKQSFASGASGLLQQADKVRGRCDDLGTLRNPDSLPEWQSACSSAEANLQTLQSHIGSMQQAFSSIEQVWAKQHGEMVNLIRAAEAAEY